MSAFVFCLHRQKRPISKQLFAPMMRTIDAFGIDGKKQIIQSNFAIGYQRFWTTPEEVGEKQPLQDKEIHTWLVFDGRIDNRKEIYALMPNKHRNLVSLSDAKLFLELYKQTGCKYFEKIVGPFVFVLFDENTNKVFAGRDAMGGRHLVYRITENWVVIATFDAAVNAHKEFGFELNEVHIVKHFLAERALQPITFSKGLKQLQPGYEMVINRDRVDLKNQYLLDPEKRIKLNSNEEYTEAFNEIFTASVSDRLRSISPVASMTSGGMDSLPMSLIAAELLRKNNQQLHTISWVFDRYAESDERQYITPVAEKYGFNTTFVNGDTAWPLKDQWATHPCAPFSTPFRTLHNIAYEQCNNIGAKVALSGMGGDMLYIGYEMQLYELIKEGRFREAYQEFQRRKKNLNSTMATLKMHFLWSTKLYRQLKQSIGNRQPDYLTNYAQQFLEPGKHWLFDAAQYSIRPNQYLRLLDTYEGEGNAGERYYCAQYKFEMRYPFRDKRLVEFMLQIPTEQLNFNDRSRVVMRNAMQDKLPENILNRNAKATFKSLFKQGMIEQNDLLNHLLYDFDYEWSNYVKADYINSNSNEYNHRLMLKWMCASLQYWRKTVVCNSIID